MPRRPTATTAVGLFDILDDSQRQKGIFEYSDTTWNYQTTRIMAMMLFCRAKGQRRSETPQGCHRSNSFPPIPTRIASLYTHVHIPWLYVFITALGGHRKVSMAASNAPPCPINRYTMSSFPRIRLTGSSTSSSAVCTCRSPTQSSWATNLSEHALVLKPREMWHPYKDVRRRQWH